MQKRKLFFISAGIVVLLIFFAGFFWYMWVSEKAPDDKYVADAEEGDITRYEWIKLLAEDYGMTEPQGETPYFSDVSSDSGYFDCVQALVEWNVLKADGDLEGDGYASGRFAALTAMRVVGEKKLQMYLDTRKEISDKDFLDAALAEGFIKEEELAAGISKEESSAILERLRALYDGVFTPADYVAVEYQEGIVEIDTSDLVSVSETGDEMFVSTDVSSSLEEGAIIVFSQGTGGVRRAGRVISIGQGGRVQLETVEPEAVLSFLCASSKQEISFEDMATYCGLSEEHLVAETEMPTTEMMLCRMEDVQRQIPTATLGSDPFSLELRTEEDEESGKNNLKIQLTNEAKHVSYQFPNNIEMGNEDFIHTTIEIEKMELSAQAEFKGGLQYAEVALDMETSMSNQTSISKECKILLADAMFPVFYGIGTVQAQLYLVVGMDGSLEIQAELPMYGSVRYEKGNGIRKRVSDLKVQKPQIRVNCELNLNLRGEPILAILGKNMIDMEADVGISARAEAVTRKTGQLCAEIFSSYPTFALSISEDEDADAVVANLGINARWEIMPAEKAPFQLRFHYERMPEDTQQFVTECTYDEADMKEPEERKPEPKKEETDNEPEMSGNYTTKYGERNAVTCPEFSFDYPKGWRIANEEYPTDQSAFSEYVVLSNSKRCGNCIFKMVTRCS